MSFTYKGLTAHLNRHISGILGINDAAIRIPGSL